MHHLVRRPLPIMVVALGAALGAASVAQDTRCLAETRRYPGLRRKTSPHRLPWTGNSPPSAGHNPSSPAVADGAVFFASGNRVFAVDAASRTHLEVPGPGVDDGHHTSPVVWNSTVYIAAGDGKAYSLDSKTGRPGWQFNAGSSIASSPTLLDGVLYFGSADGRVLGSRREDRQPDTGLEGRRTDA